MTEMTMTSDDETSAPVEFVVHLLPAIGRSPLTECCRRPLRELPKADHVTDDPADATCPDMAAWWGHDRR